MKIFALKHSGKVVDYRFNYTGKEYDHVKDPLYASEEMDVEDLPMKGDISVNWKFLPDWYMGRNLTAVRVVKNIHLGSDNRVYGYAKIFGKRILVRHIFSHLWATVEEA